MEHVNHGQATARQRLAEIGAGALIEAQQAQIASRCLLGRDFALALIARGLGIFIWDIDRSLLRGFRAGEDAALSAQLVEIEAVALGEENALAGGSGAEAEAVTVHKVVARGLVERARAGTVQNLAEG